MIGEAPFLTVFELRRVVYVKKFYIAWGRFDANPITSVRFIGKFEPAPFTVFLPYFCFRQLQI